MRYELLLNQIDKRKNAILQLIDVEKNKLLQYPEGRIKISRIKNQKYYYHVVDDSEPSGRLLSKDETDFVRDLVQKSYLSKVIKVAEQEYKLLKQIIDRYPKVTVEKVYETLPKERRELVTPVYLPDDEYVRRWQNEPYERKGFSESAAYYVTLKNERVRSKSEQLIADRLNYKGIPYKYECPLKVGDETYHPDFTILRLSDREEVYYEHRGRMDDPKYIEDNMPRYRNYSLNGIVLGEKLFISEETRAFPLDMRTIDDLIERCFR